MAFCCCSKVLATFPGLLVILVGIFYATMGEATYCDCKPNGAQCYGPLGGTIVIKLVERISEIPNVEIIHKTSKILKVKKNDTIWVSSQSKYSFFRNNGTMNIRDLAANDSGEYTLETFDSDGRKRSTQTIQLLLEAPVSSVKLVPECLSEGQVMVSCVSTGGDSPKYNWTLDGHILSDSKVVSKNNKPNIITLKNNISGHLVCSVSTKVNSLFTEKYVPSCGFVNCTSNGKRISSWVFKDNNTLCDKPVDKYNIMELLPIIGGALGALLLATAVIIAIVCAKRKKHNKNEGERDDQELSNDNLNKRQQEQSGESQIQYGQVKKQARQSTMYGNIENSVYGNMEESIYANM